MKKTAKNNPTKDIARFLAIAAKWGILGLFVHFTPFRFGSSWFESIAMAATLGCGLDLIFPITESLASGVAHLMGYKSGKGQVSAIFAPSLPESAKKGNFRLIPINGGKKQIQVADSGVFSYALSALGYSRSTVKPKTNIIMIKGDCAPPDSPYEYGQVPVQYLRKMLRATDLGKARGEKDSGQWLSFNSLVANGKTRWLDSSSYWLLINTINAASDSTGTQLVRITNKQKWSRLKYPGLWTYGFILSWLKSKEG
jgi:hypothetical protein